MENSEGVRNKTPGATTLRVLAPFGMEFSGRESLRTHASIYKPHAMKKASNEGPCSALAEVRTHSPRPELAASKVHEHYAAVVSRILDHEELKVYMAVICRRGDFEAVQAIASGGLVSRAVLHVGMGWACRRGRLDVVETIIRHGDVDVSQFVQQHGSHVFTRAGLDGFAQVAQWLLDAGLTPSPSDWKEAFVWACMGGHLATAQWVVDHAPGAVEIHCKLANAFDLSFRRGHLHVAKWLVSLGHVDIHADDNRAMTKAVHLGRPDMCRWLLGLDPDDAAWPAWIFPMVRVWSSVRDVWMRSVARPRMP